jgi:hypothetical protein
MSAPSKQPRIVVEIAHFGVHEGTDRDAVLAAANRSQAYVTRCEGFMSRRLCEPTEAEPRWVDIIEWRDLTSAQKAAEGLMKSDDCAPFMALIDEKTVAMQHPVAHQIAS